MKNVLFIISSKKERRTTLFNGSTIRGDRLNIRKFICFFFFFFSSLFLRNNNILSINFFCIFFFQNAGSIDIIKRRFYFSDFVFLSFFRPIRSCHPRRSYTHNTHDEKLRKKCVAKASVLYVMYSVFLHRFQGENGSGSLETQLKWQFDSYTLAVPARRVFSLSNSRHRIKLDD